MTTTTGRVGFGAVDPDGCARRTERCPRTGSAEGKRDRAKMRPMSRPSVAKDPQADDMALGRR
jgi:hypothetical protein